MKVLQKENKKTNNISETFIFEAISHYINKHPVSKTLVGKKFQLLTELNIKKIEDYHKLIESSNKQLEELQSKIINLSEKVTNDLIKLRVE